MPAEVNLSGAPGEWQFDAEVTEIFDEMLERSIPDYERMRSLVVSIVDRFLVRGPDRQPKILDLGTSRGGMIADLWHQYGAACSYLGVEVSEPMLESARARFSKLTEWITVEHLDLRYGYPTGSFDVVLSVLTLMFTPIEHRLRILRDVHSSLRPGGAFVLVEKVIGNTADIDAALVDLYHSHKERAGYSRVEIDRKRIALEGVLVPVTSRMNAELLEASGFRASEVFWRSLNFEARLAVR